MPEMDLHCLTAWLAYRQELYDTNWFGGYVYGEIEVDYLEEYAKRKFQEQVCGDSQANACEGIRGCDGLTDRNESLKCWAQNEVAKCKCHENACNYFDKYPERCTFTPPPAPAPAPNTDEPAPVPAPMPKNTTERAKRLVMEKQKLEVEWKPDKIIPFPTREFKHNGLVARDSLWAQFARLDHLDKNCDSSKMKNRPNCVSMSMDTMDPAFLLMPDMKCFLEARPFAMIPNDIREATVHMKVSSGPKMQTSQVVDLVFNTTLPDKFKIALFTEHKGGEVVCKSSVESHVLFHGNLAGPCRLAR